MNKKSEIILISASAGSGKTHALTRRYVRLLLGGAAPESILAVTFTNNAAKEMKERVLGWLKKAASGAEGNETAQLMADTGLALPALKAKASAILQDLLCNYYNVHVQTIDSFLNRIAMSSAGELGMPLNPEITMSHRRLVDVALYSILSKEGRCSLSREEVDEFLKALPPGNAYPWDPVEKMREIYGNFLAFEGKSDGQIVPADIKDKDAQDAKDAVVSAGAAFLKALDAGKYTYTTKSKPKEPKLYADALKNGVREAIASGNQVRIAGCFSRDYGFFSGGKVRTIVIRPELAGPMAEVSAAIGAYYRLHAYHRLNGFVKLYPKFKEELERIKSGLEDVAHIDDIAKKITGYLKKNGGTAVPEVYIRLGERVEHFLIDEFQDTDPLQWRALLPLVQEALARGGSLFVVGDIKQAIYMFRYADYKIMREFMDVLYGLGADGDPLGMEALVSLTEPGDRKIEKLEVNRRSGGVLVKYAADLFKTRLPAYRAGEVLADGNDPTGLTTYSQSAEEGKETAGLARELVFSRKALREKSKTAEAEEADEEAAGDITDQPVGAKVVELIKEAHARYRYDQIAVLAPQNKYIRAVVSWLNAAGLPVASMSSLDIRERPVVAELIALFTFLEFPANDIAFMNFACGELFLKASGLQKEELLAAAAEHREKHHGGRPLYTTFKERHPGPWEELLEPLFAKIGYLPVYELAALAFSSLKVFERFREESCFLVKFLEVLSALQGKGAADARSFINFASDDGEDAAGAFSIELPEYIDAVRVMTFHKAKGLGFPVVINLLYEKRGQGGSASDKNIFYDQSGPGGEVRIVYINKEYGDWDAKLKELYEGREADEKVQALNELYVVTTRAKAELSNLVVRNSDEQGGGSAGKFHYVFGDEERGAPDVSAKAEPPAHKPSRITQPVFPDVPASSAGTTLEGHRAAQRGLLYHDILMRVDWLGGDLKARLASAFDACAWKYSPVLRAERAAIADKLFSLLGKPAVAAFFEQKPGRALKRETSFISGPEGGRLRRIDRLLLEGAAPGGKAVIVDFKTGGEYPGYEETLKKYAAAVSDAFGRPAECWLIYLDEEKAEKVL
ncbi:MAG TPA: hypothetical protein DCZ92_08735 [Elusimicrobia bacterium]|nr:MAG: hypothetical protein A2016_01785 [Elusimicrobia bacterium GWF2_62_30]HBA60891.1 hypothetical protein [Elusimicrobiota bacterium]